MFCLSCSFGLHDDRGIFLVVLRVFYHSVDVEAHCDVHPDHSWDCHVGSLLEVTHPSHAFQVVLHSKYDCDRGNDDHEGGDEEVKEYVLGGKGEPKPA